MRFGTPQVMGGQQRLETPVVRGLVNRPTLVLNRNWQPIHVATVARALVMLYSGTVHVVDPEDFQTYTWEDWARLRPRDGEPCIRSVRFRLRVPEVVTLVRYDRLPIATVTFSRRNLFKRDRFACQYCGAQPGTHELTIDHVVPRSQGGTSCWSNCVLACVACNKRKADRTPEQAGLKLRKKPARPGWRPLYAFHDVRVESWSRFLSEAYWNVRLQD
jgi:5-methylcytosine-specific restriction endonuclease McrA